MVDPIAVKFRVTINQGHNELYDVFKKMPPYYRQKRLLQLAALGLAVEGRFAAGGLVAPVQPATNTSSSQPKQSSRKKPAAAPRNNVDSKTEDARHYKITPNATDLLAGVLGDLGAFD